MRKIINIVCGIFVLCLTMENINFVYAQNEITENTQTGGVTNGLTVEELPNDLEIQDGENSRSSTILRGAPALGIPQTMQTIDTSDYGIIRIKDPNNTGKGITMLDRNLGATATGAGVDESRQSFGYYFQWGNNYGFPSDSNAEISTTTDQADASEYGPNTENGYYSSNIFVKGNSDWSSVRNDDLRGGSGDSRDGNNRGYPVTNPEDRRGPCPENYHIPSIGEWSKLLEFRANNYTGTLTLLTDPSTNLKYFKNEAVALEDFYYNFYIPIAGYRRYRNSNFENLGIQILLQSSSSKNPANAIFLLFGENSNLYSNGYTENRGNAFPIRCFYDSYWLPIKITYNVNGGYRTDDGGVQQKIIIYTKEDDSSEYSGDMLLGKVKRDNICGENRNKKCIFGGWYTLTDDELWTGNLIEDITLYAKWLEFDDKDISYSGVKFSIMDRNLGAVDSGIDENAYGYYLTGGEKDIVCPEGYHVPSSGEWLGIKKLLGSDFNGDLVKGILNLPFAGKVENGVIIETGETGYYLSRNGDKTMYAKIGDSNIEIEHIGEGEKVPVRCFKDYSVGIIKFNSNGGNNITDMETVNWREDGENLAIPTKDHSVFLGWYNQDNVKIEKNVNYKNEEEINLYAKWDCEQGYQKNGNKCEEISKPSEGSSGGGGRGSIPKDIDIASGTKVRNLTGNTQDSPIDNSFSEGQNFSDPSLSKEGEDYSFSLNKGEKDLADEILLKDFSQEFIDAYNFAYKNGITTRTSIYDAKMYSPLTRIQMAKMLSYYAINVLGREPNISKGVVKFDDVSNKLNKEYDNAVTLSYQLGIMGQNIKNNKFRPYDEVTRAEFSTALSRLLYGTKDGEYEYYEPHITNLYDKGVINKTYPSIKEKRGYIMIVLMRSVK